MSFEYVLGVTGSMGCGKSYTCKKLVEIGNGTVSHINTDLLGREILGTALEYKDLRRQIFQSFGHQFENEDTSVKRKELGELLFQDKVALEEFNRILLPEALKRVQNEMEKNTSPLLLVESALFAEYRFFDIVQHNMLLVYANKEIQMGRLSKGELPADQVKGRIASQFSYQEKLEGIVQAQKEAGQGKLFLFDTSLNPSHEAYKELLGHIWGECK